MSDYITDPALLEKISKTEPGKEEYVSDPALLDKISQAPQADTKTAVSTEEFGAGELAQMVAPAATTASLNPTLMPLPDGAVGPPKYAVKPQGYNPQAIKQAVQPILDVVPRTYKQYTAPGGALKGAIDILGVGSVGVPPVAAIEAGKSLVQLPGAIGQSVAEVSRMASASEPISSPAGTGNMYPKTTPSFRQMWTVVNAQDPAMAKALQEMFKTGGGVNQVNSWLLSDEGKKYMADPKFKAAADEFSSLSRSRLSQVGRAVAPVARTAARVLGPVGLGMDVYQAQQFAKESELGPRLAQGQGRQAQQAFRNRNQTYGPIAPDQAQAVLQSGSERDIAAFGGRDKLSQMIRLKAAERVLGPIAPGQ